MVTKKSARVLFGILVISAWILGSAIQVGAETMNYKLYTWVVKVERAMVGDMEGHNLNLTIRRAFCVFENGETGTSISVITGDSTKTSGALLVYTTITFPDSSTIVVKLQGMIGGGATVGGYTSSKLTGEIIKGTGRFEGIKGTYTSDITHK